MTELEKVLAGLLRDAHEKVDPEEAVRFSPKDMNTMLAEHLAPHIERAFRDAYVEGYDDNAWLTTPRSNDGIEVGTESLREALNDES